MNIYKYSNQNNFNFYYVDTTYELNLIKNNNKIEALPLIVSGRLLSVVVLTDHVLRRFYSQKTVSYRFFTKKVGMYQISIDKDLNVGIYVENPHLITNETSGIANVNKFLLNENQKVEISFWDENLNCELDIRSITCLESTYGDVAGDFIKLLNSVGMKRVALSLGVELDLFNNKNVVASGGFLCHVYNKGYNVNVISQLKQSLDSTLPIKDLQTNFNHDVKKIFAKVLGLQKIQIDLVASYNLNQLNFNNNIVENIKTLNLESNDSIPLLGISEDNTTGYLVWASKGKKTNFANFDFNLQTSKLKICESYHLKNVSLDFEITGNSYALSVIIWSIFKNSKFCASGVVDEFGNVLWVNNIISKIKIAQEFNFEKIFVPIACKASISQYKEFDIEIVFVENIHQLMENIKNEKQ